MSKGCSHALYIGVFFRNSSIFKGIQDTWIKHSSLHYILFLLQFIKDMCRYWFTCTNIDCDIARFLVMASNIDRYRGSNIDIESFLDMASNIRPLGVVSLKNFAVPTWRGKNLAVLASTPTHPLRSSPLVCSSFIKLSYYLFSFLFWVFQFSSVCYCVYEFTRRTFFSL